MDFQTNENNINTERGESDMPNSMLFALFENQWRSCGKGKIRLYLENNSEFNQVKRILSPEEVITGELLIVLVSCLKSMESAPKQRVDDQLRQLLVETTRIEDPLLACRAFSGTAFQIKSKEKIISWKHGRE